MYVYPGPRRCRRESRYEGSFIKKYKQFEYDRATFPSGKEDGELQTTTVEGKLTKIFYRAPERPSVLQVQRSYQMALQDAGFEILYKCDKQGLGSKDIGGLVTASFFMTIKMHTIFWPGCPAKKVIFMLR